MPKAEITRRKKWLVRAYFVDLTSLNHLGCRFIVFRCSYILHHSLKQIAIKNQTSYLYFLFLLF